MNTEYVKVLDNGSGVVNLKRKQPDRGNIPNHAKHRKVDGLGSKYYGCALPTKKYLLKYYSNFKKSEPLHRLMYYYNDEWNEFPQYVVTIVNKDFLVKKSAVEVEVDGSMILLDFLRMMLLDFKTGLHQPFGWIDVTGKCFFPEIFSHYEPDDAQYHHNLGSEGHSHLGGETPKPNYVNLNLEIEIRRSDEESSGDFSPIVVNVQAHQNAALEDVDEVNSCSKIVNVDIGEECGDNQQMAGNMVLSVKPVNRSLSSHAVMELLCKAFSSCSAEVVEILPCKSTVMESRLELFEKQVEITQRHRGDANVQYAWLPCSSRMVSTVLKYGIGHYNHLKINASHGNGIHLIPANGTQISISSFDVDKNETRHMVLCRVIMGNMELVRCDSKQFYPSCEDFDSGVDRLQTPNIYVVWSMNTNSHIYPECIVSFKTSDLADPLCVQQNEVCISRFSCFEGPQTQIVGETVRSRAPKSPCVPFPMLFTAIADKVTSERMNLVRTNYTLLKNKKMSRDAFVKKLRLIVGDNVLKSAITTLQCEVLPTSNAEKLLAPEASQF
ncbi:inactive poly [ADP-ribose] polymerase RCD1 [Striga asiatica]|uniref:Inactive poly [ADP-ribose] polymerase RCD1 n=1 Tax=Striga asiatica TaxID=4170 RepID=A0A5A7QFE3_STRAF|nr:inactive poly [ADP-ribose] polymerase RCD1 [Striga asiatica]